MTPPPMTTTSACAGNRSSLVMRLSGRGHAILLKVKLIEAVALHGMFMRGSSASRSPSPRKLKLVTASVMATPGAIASQGALVM